MTVYLHSTHADYLQNKRDAENQNQTSPAASLSNTLGYEQCRGKNSSCKQKLNPEKVNDNY